MNGIERIQAAITFRAPDRVPVIAQVFGHAATLAGVAVEDYVRDGELVAGCQRRALEEYGYDAVFALMDVAVETEALGSVLEYRRGQYPVVMSYALDGSVDVGTLSLPDPHRDGRMPELLKAAEILSHEVGHEVLVVGCVVGPMTLATQLLGLEAALFLAVDEPRRFVHLLDFCVEVVARFGAAQIEAGVHLPVVFDPSASPAVIPPQFFRELELPRLQELLARLREAGAMANWLHITGPTEPILPLYPSAGVDIANIDYLVQPAAAMRALPETCVDGNIKPLSLVESTPDAIVAESRSLLNLFANRGGFILSPGCEVPLKSRPENIAAMVSATRNRG